MKILHTVRGLLKRGGGPAYTVPSLASAQARIGAQVSILLDEDEFAYDVPEGVSIIHRSQLNQTLGEFVRAFDIVHDHGVWLPCNHRVAVAARNVKVPRVISPRGALQGWVWEQRRWKKELGWFLYQKKDLYTANAVFATAAIESERVKQLGYQGYIIEVPNGVDPPGDVQREERQQRCALFMSRVHPKKGIQELITAWIEVAPIGWRLAIAGPDGDGLIGDFLQQVKNSGKNVDVSWLEMLQGDAKCRAFNDADLFVLPTFSENFGVSVIEAMLMQLPVITTTGTPWCEIEKLGQGWLIEPEIDQLVTALRKAISIPPEELRKKGVRAREWSQGRFSWDSIAKNSLDSYEQIIEEWVH